MSTTQNNILDSALSNIPNAFRNKIIKSYLEIKTRASTSHYNSNWDTPGLSAGKFSETILRFLQKHLTGSNTPFGQHISNFPGECRKLIQLPHSRGNESLRVIIPRALVFIYTLRGKRGIGHVGGDLNANEIDIFTIVRVADWIVCEFIRIFHNISLEEAQSIIDSIAIKFLPDVWEISGKKRVLRKGLSYKQKTLLLLYSESENGILTEDLFDWVKHSKITAYKKDVLKPLHKDNLIEYDIDNEIIQISPTGINEVESNILK